jgi:hypothetical protein
MEVTVSDAIANGITIANQFGLPPYILFVGFVLSAAWLYKRFNSATNK